LELKDRFGHVIADRANKFSPLKRSGQGCGHLTHENLLARRRLSNDKAQVRRPAPDALWRKCEVFSLCALCAFVGKTFCEAKENSFEPRRNIIAQICMRDAQRITSSGKFDFLLLGLSHTQVTRRHRSGDRRQMKG
jgi:hypothetical protein